MNSPTRVNGPTRMNSPTTRNLPLTWRLLQLFPKRVDLLEQRFPLLEQKFDLLRGKQALRALPLVMRDGGVDNEALGEAANVRKVGEEAGQVLGDGNAGREAQTM